MTIEAINNQAIPSPYNIAALKSAQQRWKNRKAQAFGGVGLTVTGLALLPVVGPFGAIVSSVGLAILAKGFFSENENMPISKKTMPLVRVNATPSQLAEMSFQTLTGKPFDPKTARAYEVEARDIFHAIAKNDSIELVSKLRVVKYLYPNNFPAILAVAIDLSTLLNRQQETLAQFTPDEPLSESGQPGVLEKGIGIALGAGAILLGVNSLRQPSSTEPHDPPPPPPPPILDVCFTDPNTNSSSVDPNKPIFPPIITPTIPARPIETQTQSPFFLIPETEQNGTHLSSPTSSGAAILPGYAAITASELLQYAFVLSLPPELVSYLRSQPSDTFCLIPQGFLPNQKPKALALPDDSIANRSLAVSPPPCRSENLPLSNATGMHNNSSTKYILFALPHSRTESKAIPSKHPLIDPFKKTGEITIFELTQEELRWLIGLAPSPSNESREKLTALSAILKTAPQLKDEKYPAILPPKIERKQPATGSSEPQIPNAKPILPQTITADESRRKLKLLSKELKSEWENLRRLQALVRNHSVPFVNGPLQDKKIDASPVPFSVPGSSQSISSELVPEYSEAPNAKPPTDITPPNSTPWIWDFSWIYSYGAALFKPTDTQHTALPIDPSATPPAQLISSPDTHTNVLSHLAVCALTGAVLANLTTYTAKKLPNLNPGSGVASLIATPPPTLIPLNKGLLANLTLAPQTPRNLSSYLATCVAAESVFSTHPTTKHKGISADESKRKLASLSADLKIEKENLLQLQNQINNNKVVKSTEIAISQPVIKDEDRTNTNSIDPEQYALSIAEYKSYGRKFLELCSDVSAAATTLLANFVDAKHEELALKTKENRMYKAPADTFFSVASGMAEEKATAMLKNLAADASDIGDTLFKLFTTTLDSVHSIATNSLKRIQELRTAVIVADDSPLISTPGQTQSQKDQDSIPSIDPAFTSENEDKLQKIPSPFPIARNTDTPPIVPSPISNRSLEECLNTKEAATQSFHKNRLPPFSSTNLLWNQSICKNELETRLVSNPEVRNPEKKDVRTPETPIAQITQCEPFSNLSGTSAIKESLFRNNSILLKKEISEEPASSPAPVPTPWEDIQKATKEFGEATREFVGTIQNIGLMGCLNGIVSDLRNLGSSTDPASVPTATITSTNPTSTPTPQAPSSLHTVEPSPTIHSPVISHENVQSVQTDPGHDNPPSQPEPPTNDSPKRSQQSRARLNELRKKREEIQNS